MVNTKMTAKLANMTEINFTPMGDNLIIELIKPKEVTEGGIIIPDQAKEQEPRAYVLAAGPDAECKKGDEILINMAMPREVLLPEGVFLMVSEDKGVYGIFQ